MAIYNVMYSVRTSNPHERSGNQSITTYRFENTARIDQFKQNNPKYNATGCFRMKYNMIKVSPTTKSNPDSNVLIHFETLKVASVFSDTPKKICSLTPPFA